MVGLRTEGLGAPYESLVASCVVGCHGQESRAVVRLEVSDEREYICGWVRLGQLRPQVNMEGRVGG